jgi:hypothetical protein
MTLALTDTLHGPIREFVESGAAALGCDPSYVALPLRSELAAAIGATRRIRLKRNWVEPAVNWTVIVGDSGTVKSPAWELATRPLLRRQTAAFDRYRVAMANYQRDLLSYEAALRDWKDKGAKRGEPPEKPVEPIAERYIVSDTTVEGLAPILESQPRGVLLSRDELDGWLGSFDQYKARAGSDTANWLSMHRAGPITIDRKTSRQIIHVPRAAVSVTGGIQPEVLRRALAGLHIEDGLASRLLFAFPPRRLKRWTEAVVSEAVEAALDDIFERLLTLDFTDRGEPIDLNLDAAAKAHWITFYDDHNAEQRDSTGPLAAAWSKLEGYAARLALVSHFSRWAAGDDHTCETGPIDLTSIKAGIAQARWFGREAQRVYDLFTETDEDRERRRLIEWIDRRGEPVTPRDVQQGCRWLKKPGTAEAALDELVKDKYGTWEQSSAGQPGQPTRRFRLSPPSTVYGNPVNPEKSTNTVDVDDLEVA